MLTDPLTEREQNKDSYNYETPNKIPQNRMQLLQDKLLDFILYLMNICLAFTVLRFHTILDEYMLSLHSIRISYYT